MSTLRYTRVIKPAGDILGATYFDESGEVLMAKFVRRRHVFIAKKILRHGNYLESEITLKLHGLSDSAVKPLISRVRRNRGNHFQTTRMFARANRLELVSGLLNSRLVCNSIVKWARL